MFISCALWTQALESLQGKSIPKLIAVAEAPFGSFVALQRLDAVPLSNAAAEHVTQEVMQQAETALRAVHDCGIVHGDISAHNIMLEAVQSPPASQGSSVGASTAGSGCSSSGASSGHCDTALDGSASATTYSSSHSPTDQRAFAQPAAHKVWLVDLGRARIAASEVEKAGEMRRLREVLQHRCADRRE
jgi:serine/threonine protein kinase